MTTATNDAAETLPPKDFLGLSLTVFRACRWCTNVRL